MAETRKGAATLKGNPIDLVGPQLKPGDPAPDFELQGADLGQVKLADTAGKTRVLLTVPSLDTPVCHAEAKRFNDEIAKLPGVELLCVSMDLPFAQKRWCGAEHAERIRCLSAHDNADFGKNYGVLIKGGPLNRILSRAVFVIGADNRLKHVEYVKEVAEHPNYAAALAAAKA